MKTYPKGENYAYVQRMHNYKHSNGAIEAEGDWEHAEELVDLVADWCEPASILVVGCRTGYETCLLKQEFENSCIVGVDIVEEFIQQAATRTPALVADMHQLPFGNDSFELVVSIGTLEHCYDPAQALREMHRVVASKAYITADLEEDRGAYGSHYAFSKDRDEWLDMFKACGFVVDTVNASQGTSAQGIHVKARKV
jgi:ubiquinone/menaquinone biosynthesis C-methylase UbiE